MCQPDTTPTPASPTQALAGARAWLGTLVAVDPIAMPAEAQAECLQGLEQIEAVLTAARALILGAFTAGHGYSADAAYSARAWLIHKTGVSKGAAAGHIGWARRVTTHPQVVAALAQGTILSESLGRKLCSWTDKLPGDCRQAADEILHRRRPGRRRRAGPGRPGRRDPGPRPAGHHRRRPGLRGPLAAPGDHHRRCRTPERRSDPRMHGRHVRGTGRAVRSDGRGGHPHPRPALP